MGPSAKPPRNGLILQETIHSYLSTMERQSRSNLIKLLFADDASIVSSTNSEDRFQDRIKLWVYGLTRGACVNIQTPFYLPLCAS